MKRLFISGGSSAIGQAIIALAKERDWEVLAPTHDELDVSEALDVASYFHGAGKIDGIVNSASLHSRIELIQQPVDATIDTILKGTIYCIREFTRNNTSGVIVNVSSEAARTGGFRLSVYAAAKAGVNTLTLALSRELAPYFRVNAVSLGIIDTPSNQDKDGSRLPFKRKGTVREVAQVVLWLLSDEASYVSGDVVSVAGGY